MNWKNIEPKNESLTFSICRNPENDTREIECTIINTKQEKIEFMVEDKNDIMSAFYNSEKNGQGTDHYFKNVQMKKKSVTWQEFEPPALARFIDESNLKKIKSGEKKGKIKKMVLLPKKSSGEIFPKITASYSKEKKEASIEILYNDKKEMVDTRHIIPQKTLNFMFKEQLLILLSAIVYDSVFKKIRITAPHFAYQTKLATSSEDLKKYTDGHLEGRLLFEFTSYKNQLIWERNCSLPKNHSYYSLPKDPSYEKFEMSIIAKYTKKIKKKRKTSL